MHRLFRPFGYVVALAAIFNPALAHAKRTIYFAQGVLGSCRIAPKFHYPSAGYGANFLLFNPSTVDQTVSLNVTIEYTGQGVGQKQQKCVLSGITLAAGKSLLQGCTIPAGWPNALTHGMIQAYGQIESVDSTGKDAGFVVASGSIWACIAHTDGASPVSDPTNFPFLINSGKPF